MLGSMAALLAQSQVDKMMARIVGERPRITGYSLTGTFKGTKFDSWKKIDSHAPDVCVFLQYLARIWGLVWDAGYWSGRSRRLMSSRD